MPIAGKPQGIRVTAPGAASGGGGKERSDRLQEGLRLLGMDPVPGAFYAGDPSLWE